MDVAGTLSPLLDKRDIVKRSGSFAQFPNFRNRGLKVLIRTFLLREPSGRCGLRPARLPMSLPCVPGDKLYNIKTLPKKKLHPVRKSEMAERS